jgi:hypothetical protein
MKPRTNDTNLTEKRQLEWNILLILCTKKEPFRINYGQYKKKRRKKEWNETR